MYLPRVGDVISIHADGTSKAKWVVTKADPGQTIHEKRCVSLFGCFIDDDSGYGGWEGTSGTWYYDDCTYRRRATKAECDKAGIAFVEEPVEPMVETWVDFARRR